MTQIQKKKTALQEALQNFVQRGQYNPPNQSINWGQVGQNVKQAINPFLNTSKNALQDFTKNLAKDYENWNKQQSIQVQQNRQNLLNLGKRIVASPITQTITTPVMDTLKMQAAMEARNRIPIYKLIPGIGEQLAKTQETGVQEILREKPQLFQPTSPTGPLVPSLQGVTQGLKTFGIARTPLQVVAGGAVNIPFQAVANIMEGKPPLQQDFEKTIAEGMDFMALLGPLSTAAELPLAPILKRIKPQQINKINIGIDALKKAADTPTARQKLVDLGRNIAAEFIRSGVGFGAYEALQPTKDMQQRINNALYGFAVGGAFGVGTQALIMGGKAGLRVTKAGIRAYQGMTPQQQQAGFARIGKPLPSPDILDTLKEAIKTDEPAAQQLYKDFQKDFQLPSYQSLVKETKVILPTPILEKPTRATVEEIVNSVLTEGPEVGRTVYTRLASQFRLLPFEELQRVAQQQVSEAESSLIREVTNEALVGNLAKTPEVAQFKDVIQTAVRLWNISKAKGKEDIATITNRLAQNPKYQGANTLDSALQVLKGRGIDITTMEELADFAKGFAKPKGMKVGKPVMDLSSIPNLAEELASPQSVTRQAIRRAFLTRVIDEEIVAGRGQLKVLWSEIGKQPEIFEKGFTGKLRLERGVLPPAVVVPGQKVIPETGVIPPQILKRLVDRQMIRLREMRKRAGITQKEFQAVAEKITGKPTAVKMTLEERKKAISLLEPENREQLETDVIGVRILRGNEQAKAIQEGMNQVKSVSPLENEIGGVKSLLNIFGEIANLQKSSEIWQPVNQQERKFLKRALTGKVPAFLLQFVREPQSARIAGTELSFYGPSLAVQTVTNRLTSVLKTTFQKIISATTPEEQKGIAYLTTGIRGKEFQRELGRLPTVKEIEYAKYLKELFDAHLVLINTIREIAGKQPLGKIKDYLPFILDEQIRLATNLPGRSAFYKTRLKTKEEFKAGLFSRDLQNIFNRFTDASEFYTRINLAEAVLQNRLKELPRQSPMAGIFGELIFKNDIYAAPDTLDQAMSTTRGGINDILGRLAFPKKYILSPREQKAIQQSEFYQNDIAYKEMIDKGFAFIPHDWAKVPDFSSATMKAIYMAKLGFGNTLFTLVNFAQPSLAVSETSVRDVAKAYAQMGRIIAFLDPTKAKAVQSALEEGKVLEFTKYGGEYVGRDVDLLNRFLDGTAKYVNFNVRLSEIGNRMVTLLAGVNYLTKMNIEQELNLSREGILRAATEYSGRINVVGGRGYSPFIIRKGPWGFVYMFTQFPLQAIDILSRDLKIAFSPEEKRKVWELMFTSTNAPTKDIMSIRNMKDPSGFLKKFGRFLIGFFGTSAVVTASTAAIGIPVLSAVEIGKRYLPTIPIPDNPMTQLVGSFQTALQDPQTGIENLQDTLNKTLQVVQAQRIADYFAYRGGGIRDDKGNLMYAAPSDSTQREREARSVLFFGRSALPEARLRQRRYELSIEATKAGGEDKKKTFEIFQESKRIRDESGLTASNDYLRDLYNKGELTDDTMKGILTLYDEEEKKIGSLQRSLKTQSVETRAKFISEELAGLATDEERTNYLRQKADQGIYTPEVAKELEKIGVQPGGLLDRVTSWVRGVFGGGNKEPITFIPAPTTVTEEKKEIFPKEIVEAQKRSDQFTDSIKIYNQYKDLPNAQFMIDDILAKNNITLDALVYDMQTKLPDDLQLDLVKTKVLGLGGQELLEELVKLRVVSEGSRKALLTDTLVNKLNNEGVITDTQSDFLKSIVWDSKNQKFIQTLAKGKKLTVPKITVPKPVLKKLQLKIPTFTPLKPIKVGRTTQIKPQKVAIRQPTISRVSLKIPTMANRLTSMRGM